MLHILLLEGRKSDLYQRRRIPRDVFAKQTELPFTAAGGTRRLSFSFTHILVGIDQSKIALSIREY